MKIGMLLSGCGVYDGSEIQEAVFTMLAIEEIGGTVQAIGIDDNQFHVINHLTGEEMPEKRNMLIEAARISRGNIIPIDQVNSDEFDALVIPGGFGNAKNLTTWAFSGPEGEIRSDIKTLIQAFHRANKYIIALCVSPVVIAKAFENTEVHPLLTIGSTQSPSPYSIADFQSGLQKTGAETKEAELTEVVVDKANKIISAPCYMMNASLLEIKKNISNALNTLKEQL